MRRPTMTRNAARSIGWGILGTAKIATKVGRAIDRARGARLVAVASRDLDRARAWAAQHRAESAGIGASSGEQARDLPPIRAVGSYEALLDDAEIDALYIPLPPSMHCEWTVRAARRGKHVLCEK